MFIGRTCGLPHTGLLSHCFCGEIMRIKKTHAFIRAAAAVLAASTALTAGAAVAQTTQKDVLREIFCLFP